MFYTISVNQYGTGKMYVPVHFHIEHLQRSSRQMTIYAGLRNQKVIVIPDSKLADSEIQVTPDVLAVLSIPTDIQYQLRVEDQKLRIGPVIGILLAQTEKFYTDKRMKKLLEYALRYEEIHGLLYLMSAESIDFEKNCAEGFYYAPGKNGTTPTWTKGSFPLPDAIFRRANLSCNVTKKLKEATGNRVFNSYFFDKWDFWQAVSKDPMVKKYLPDTRMLSSVNDIDDMLAKYESIYLKPVNGTLGNGLIKVVKVKDSYFIQGKYDKEPELISSKEKFSDYLDHIKAEGRYLVQQDIHLLKLEDRYVDFRVNIQKDYSMKWHCIGITACTGASGGIHSNYINDGYYYSFEEYMTKYLSLDPVTTFNKRQEMIGICKKVCKLLDETGENYGDLGIDIGYDQSLRPWVFEANKNQFHYIALMVDDYNAYYTARTNPVKYAAALSGFYME